MIKALSFNAFDGIFIYYYLIIDESIINKYLKNEQIDIR